MATTLDKAAQAIRDGADAAATQAANDAAANADDAASRANTAANGAESAKAAAETAASNANTAADNASSAAATLSAFGAQINGVAKSLSGTDLTLFDGSTEGASSHNGETWLVAEERAYYTSDGSAWNEEAPALAGLNSDGEVVDVPVARVASIAALKSTTPTPRMHRFVEGYHTVGDDGGGTFVWVDGDTSATDDGLVIESSVSGYGPGEANEGRWKRVRDGAIVSVKWFGAKGDGATDDQSAIQAALDSGAKMVYVPEGVYLLGEWIEVPSGVVFFGEGAKSVLRQMDGATPTAITVNEIKNGNRDIHPLVITEQPSSRDIVLRDFRVEGNTSGTSAHYPRSECGILIYGAEDTLIENCQAVDQRNDLTTADLDNYYRAFNICVASSKRTDIIGGLYNRAGYECIAIRGGAEHTTVDRAKSTDQGVARHAIQASDFPAPTHTKVINSTFTGSAGRFISHNAPWCTVVNNTFIPTDPNTSAIEVLSDFEGSDSNDTMPSQVVIEKNTVVCRNTAHGIEVRSIVSLSATESLSEHLTIANNIVEADLQGVFVRDARDVEITGNQITSNDGNAVRIRNDNGTQTSHVGVFQNVLAAASSDSGNGASGVSVEDASDVDVISNEVTQAAEGVTVAATVDEMLIKNNNLKRATAGLNVDASATNITERDNRT